MNFFVIRLQSSIMFLQGKIIVTSFKYKVMIDKLKNKRLRREKNKKNIFENIFALMYSVRPQLRNEQIYRLSGIFFIKDHS